jgi:hypothetical protein
MSYGDIMDRYLVDLAAARDEVVVWWERLLEAASPEGDVDAAQKAVRARWPLGPVSHPRIIAVFRQYYLETEAYNENKRAGGSGANVPSDPNAGWGEDPPDDEGIVEPRGLLLDSLEAYDPELSTFMQRYLFPPIGTDTDGHLA